jgi:hypothetical protein
MDMADFMKGLDRMKQQEAEKEQALRADEARYGGLRRQIVAAVQPVLEGYKAELERRGVRVQMSVSGEHVSFEMHYSRGGYYGLELKDREFCHRFTEKGSHFRASGAGPAVAEGFDLQAFEQFVQRTVEDFFLYAPRYGGYRSGG